MLPSRLALLSGEYYGFIVREIKKGIADYYIGKTKIEFDENNPNRKVYCVDVDGTLTNGERFWEDEPTPNLETIEKIRTLHKKGNIIIIHTARQWEYASDTVAWLIKNHIPFHGVFMAKGAADYYIDDRSIWI